MNKDVIYVDVDDDVTAIIGKIKAAKETVVALVPPKQSGALRSAVNLRLLARMASNEKKKLVLVTSNVALTALAANAAIPVAKNLQSAPELVPVAEAPVSTDEIIDGNDIPVGEHATQIPVRDGTRDQLRSEAIDTIDLEKEAGVPLARNPKGKNRPKIPNFDTFRKKLILGIAGGIALIALLIWMFVFAPAATVIITASTSPAPVSTSVRLSTTEATNYADGVLKSSLQTLQKDETISFDATGTGKVGEEASGTMTVTRTSVSSNSLSIPAGTRFTASSLTFVSTEGTTLAGTTIGPGGIVQDSATVEVVAEEVGAEYNLSARSYQSSVGGISANGSNMAGGSSREVKVVSDADLERAFGDLIGRPTTEAKDALQAQFIGGEKLIDSSFTVERGNPASAPAAGAEAPDGKATLTVPTTYTMYGVPKTDLESYLTKTLESQLLDDTQKIYDNGFKEAEFSNFRKDGEALTTALTTSGQIGPKIDEAAVKEQVKGQRYGEVQSTLETINGVQSVDVKFSYFWVWSVPNNTDKIEIEFKLENE